MSAVIWASPAIVPAVPPTVGTLHEYSILWHGVDGSTWDLCDRSGGVWMQAGMVGMGFAGIDRWTQTSPSLAGNLFGGSRTQALDVQWPLIVAADEPSEWKHLIRRWRQSWSKDIPGTWEVADSEGRSLTLALRWNPQPGFALDTDPGLHPRVPWMWDAIADDPHWRGEPITQQWGSGGTPQPLFDTATGMLPLHIMLASNFSTATLTNPGTVPASPVFTATGPLDQFTIGIGDQQIAGPAVGVGDSIVIYTSPDGPDAIRNGSESVIRQFTQWGSPSIPPGQTVGVEIATTGTGTIRADMTPLYEMGF